ncbi:hypothetical protein [Allisonella histaminiformans]|uniref:hypothetical protein n=1 Tax=Allisonella histaminiformans TaxID=209880 RepID=UPI0022E0BDC0|nr:hypothetical protein [Allisonella histaminiformans]
MQKKIISMVLSAALLLSGSAYADWISGNSASLTIPSGDSSIMMDLADTPILVTLKEQTPGKADVTFEPGTDAPFTLKDIPVQLFKGKAKTSPDSLNISIVPIINSGNGRTFYLIETGDADGCVLVSYHNGTFTKAFEASSVPGNWKDANIAITAKKLVLDLIDSKGTVTEYQLAYDKKSNTFYPVPIQVEI